MQSQWIAIKLQTYLRACNVIAVEKGRDCVRRHERAEISYSVCLKGLVRPDKNSTARPVPGESENEH
jgi:hypothetical protein